MKKLMITILASLVTLSLVTCTSSSTDIPQIDEEKESKDMTSPNDALIFGSVTSVDGNKLTLNISKTPQYYLEGENPDGDDTDQLSSGEAYLYNSEINGLEMGNHSKTELDPLDDIVLPDIDFEYTGESRTLIIPENLDISDMLGNDYRLCDLRKDDRLLISFESDGETYSFILVLPEK